MTLIEETAELQQELQFGNGLSLKYYNFIHFVFIPAVVINAFYNLNSLLIYFSEESGLGGKMLVSTGVIWLLFFFYIVNLIMDGLAVSFIVKKDPWKFSFWFLVRYPVSLVGILTIPIVLSNLFPVTTQDAASSLALSLFTTVGIFIPNYIYFSKRMKRPKDTSQQD